MRLRIQEAAHEHEIDLLVAWPGVGLAAIEVKGGHITRDAGTWHQGTPPHEHRAKTLSVLARSDGKPPVASLTSIEVVSLPSSRIARTIAVRSGESTSTKHIDKAVRVRVC